MAYIVTADARRVEQQDPDGWIEHRASQTAEGGELPRQPDPHDLRHDRRTQAHARGPLDRL